MKTIAWIVLLLCSSTFSWAAAENATTLEQTYVLERQKASIASVQRAESFEQLRLANREKEVLHRQKTFEFQYIQSWVIFIMVIVLVMGGFVMAYQQFRKDIKTPEQEDNGDSQQNKDNTTLELSTSGIKISSSVIGLIVLAMSFAFFYMYITHVYKINDLSLQPQPQQEKQK